jgi:hypothetical protein
MQMKELTEAPFLKEHLSKQKLIYLKKLLNKNTNTKKTEVHAI